MLAQHRKLLLRLRVGCHDRHPAIAKPGCTLESGVRRAAKPDRDRALHRRRHDADVFEIVEAPSEAHEVLRPKAAQHLDLFGLTGAARLPFRAERFVLHMVPSETDAKPQAATAEEIGLRRLLRNDSGLPLRRNENAAREPDVL